MINQQVNLFQPMFRKERKLLSFNVLLQGCGLVLVMLMAMYLWGWQQSRELDADLALLQGQLAQRTSQLEAMGARAALHKASGDPQREELARLQQEVAARQQVVAALTRVRDSYTRGVSGYLESFARQAPQGMWLTGFTVQGGGESLVIRGSSLSADLVPVFLQGLSGETALRGTHFGLLQILREQDNNHHVDFTLYTGSEPPEQAQ